ncbi:undecaprenyl-diphosphatase [Paenibacillus filicis]|uniref:Undecaprenyl-diphosphatase n=1 Tax=Paenibacillus gyeongsangnamensis TaxID=3388067 RepID=A0ABT4Q5Z0_9BACL|nr:undecaprenyl-diphosphatase [Paenibacillus filicis]MCZ8512234.1 undecaprenyl-diphosphatase [Paenibacillus filicis]
MSFVQWDYWLFEWINRGGSTFAFLNPVMRFLAEDAEYIFYLGMLVYWFTRQQQLRRVVAEALVSACLALGISGVIGSFFYRDRPFVTHHVLQLIKHAANASFPSDHAIGGFVIATTIYFFRRSAGRLWLLLAALIAFSRVWTGVHYPSDVIAGAMIGALTAALVHLAFTHFKPADRALRGILAWYDSLEVKVWAKKPKGQSLNR